MWERNHTMGEIYSSWGGGEITNQFLGGGGSNMGGKLLHNTGRLFNSVNLGKFWDSDETFDTHINLSVILSVTPFLINSSEFDNMYDDQTKKW